jgi:hypothetical protein
MSILYVMLLIARQSIHILQVPSFLGTSRTGLTYGLMFSRKHPFDINFSIAFEVPLSLHDYISRLVV